jgi:site-specific DNA-methyltransferase (adenine-specific)
MTRIERIGNATLYLGDCREILPTLPKVDAVITDPPYDEEAHAPGRRVLTRGVARNRISERKVDAAALSFSPLTVDERRAVVRWSARNCTGWFLAFCQIESVGEWKTEMVASRIRWRRAMVWVKPDSSPQLSGDRPAQGHESIVAGWCGKGRSVWNGGGKRGVFVVNKHDSGFGHGGQRNEHETQKPLQLMAPLVDLFTQPGDTVADFFAGSGSTGVAAVAAGRRFLGVERDARYFDIACRRIEDAQRQGRLLP